MRSRNVRAGIRRLFRIPLRTTRQIEADADEELRTFLAERVDDLVAHGMSPDDARAEAIRRLGAPIDDTASFLHTSAMHRERRMRLHEMFADLRQDLRYAARTLGRDATFSTFAVIIVAVGIAASSTVFSVARALLLRPLPFNDPEQLVWVQNGTSSGLSEQTAQVEPYLAFARQNRSFSEVAAYMAFYGVGDMKLANGNDAIRLSAVPVTQNFFPMLGVHPTLGRGFSAEESAWNGPKAVLITSSLWQRQFASDPNIVGKRVLLNGEGTTVVGVLPATFDFGSVFAPGVRIDLFTPFPTTPETNRWGNTLAVVARMKPGVRLTTAASEVKVLGDRITKAYPNDNSFQPSAYSLREHVSGRARSGLMVLAFAVGVVMLIVCANLSNLLLARATTRQKEMAIRAALGAGRRRLVRQMLTESVVLASCGALVGLVLAIAATRAIARLDAVSLPLLGNVAVDASAMLFTGLLAVVAGLAFGMVPALQLSETRVHDALKASGRSATDGRRGQAMRRSLVVSEIALACVLLVASGLLIRSFLNVLDVDLGFRPERVVAVRVDPEANAIRSDTQAVAYVDEVLRLARSIPGVASAALADGLPLGSNRSWGIKAAGAEYRKQQWQDGFIRIASDGFVETMGMRIVAGRGLEPGDRKPSQDVVVINETTAKQLWPGQKALGKLLKVGGEDRVVVGILADSRHLSLEEAAGNEVYLPIRQEFDYSNFTLVVRSSLEPSQLARTLRATLSPIAPNLATNDVRTLQAAVDKAISPRKFFTALLGGFSMFALSLALLGIYGVISYTVTHRRQEIGVRIALGASSRQVQGRILRETLQLAIVGIVLGTFVAWIIGRTLSGFLFGVKAVDPITYGAMVVILSVVAVVSGVVPARRASRIDPVVALRES